MYTIADIKSCGVQRRDGAKTSSYHLAIDRGGSFATETVGGFMAACIRVCGSSNS